MKTKDRLLAVDASAKGWREGVPEFSIEDVTLMRLIRVASLGITAFIDPVLRPTGLTESSYHTLIVVLASGDEGTTPSTLTEQVGQNHANMTRILSVLASEKLVRVSQDARDAARFEPIVKAAFGSLSAADKRTLQRTLRSLIESMDAAERMVGPAA
jgi:MarR family transcriptional regulator, negative regulator of the multidrug operon emrRAB